MINLDDVQTLQSIDSDNMLAHIDGLPEQFQRAWQHGQNLPINDKLKSCRHIVICGMGGSAIGGDLLAAALFNNVKLPITVIRGYELPAWIYRQNHLVIACSYSGNTEEVLSATQEALTRDVQILGITTGGKLETLLTENNHLVWTFPDEIGHPRAAIGWSFGLLLALASRLGWIEDLADDIATAVETMKKFRSQYEVGVSAAQNHAKRQAGQLMSRTPVIVGSGIFEAVAKRWKTQLNENANMFACFEPLPEMNHNTVVGIEFPQAIMSQLSVMFIASPQFDHPRVVLRHQLTNELLMISGIMTDRFEPQGNNRIAQIMHAIQFGDYLSYYTAVANGVDPAVIEPIVELKSALSSQLINQ